jgi:hypothetical protein
LWRRVVAVHARLRIRPRAKLQSAHLQLPIVEGRDVALHDDFEGCSLLHARQKLQLLRTVAPVHVRAVARAAAWQRRLSVQARTEEVPVVARVLGRVVRCGAAEEDFLGGGPEGTEDGRGGQEEERAKRHGGLLSHLLTVPRLGGMVKKGDESGQVRDIASF